MTEKDTTLKFKQIIEAPTSELYSAFTTATALCEWLCNVAEADAHEGGRLYLWWDSGYYASGEFLSLEPNQRVVFSWHGRGEPGISRVKISFTPQEAGAEVTLLHSGLSDGKAWSQARKAFKKGWKTSLENLKSVLESGQDLRFVKRPMLGVTGIEEINVETAEKLGLPDLTGILVHGTVEGMGAQAAGLQKGDVIVKFAGQDVTTVSSLINVLNHYQADDLVKVIFYRDGVRQSLKLKLSPRPLPEIPATAEVLAESTLKMYAELTTDLLKCLGGVTEQEASFKQDSQSWSVKEVLSHLIASERDMHAWIASLIEGQEADFAFQANQNTRLAATVLAFPTLAGLVDELKRNQSETAAMLAALPPEFVARKRSYWRLAYTILQTPLHFQDHSQQICSAVAAAKAGQQAQGG